MIKRLQDILKQETAPGVISDEDRNITIDRLADDRYFDENNLAGARGNLARIKDQAFKDILPIEAKIDRSIGVQRTGRRLVGKLGEGFTKPGEMQIALLKALCYFRNIGEMKSFLKLGEGELPDEANIA
ncbi:MAG: hypothetical protein LBS61_01840 [Endomicrobium sp.]|jgi:hypothetical protein|nr:hypothetical protein [Endomicrobium sp.]